MPSFIALYTGGKYTALEVPGNPEVRIPIHGTCPSMQPMVHMKPKWADSRITRTPNIPERRVMNIEDKLTRLAISLPEPAVPVANYITVVQSGLQVHTSGHIPAGLNIPGDPPMWQGILGKDLTVDQGYRAARATVLTLLSTLRSFLGNLDRIRRVLRVTGYVRCTPDFTEQPQVVNGASDLLVEIFGDRGKHVRTAVGVVSLPKGVPVEIDMTVEVEPTRKEVVDV